MSEPLRESTSNDNDSSDVAHVVSATLNTSYSTRSRLKLPLVGICFATSAATLGPLAYLGRVEASVATDGDLIASFMKTSNDTVIVYSKGSTMEMPIASPKKETSAAARQLLDDRDDFPPPDTTRSMDFREMSARLRQVFRPVEEPEHLLDFDPDDYPFR